MTSFPNSYPLNTHNTGPYFPDAPTGENSSHVLIERIRENSLSGDNLIPFMNRDTINAVNPSGEPPLSVTSAVQIAVQKNNVEEFFALVQQLPRPDTLIPFNSGHVTPLHLAISLAHEHHNPGIVTRFIEQWPNTVNTPTAQNRSPLYLAIELQNMAILDILLHPSRKININASNGSTYITALHRAVQLDNMGIVEKLLKANANPNMIDVYSFTPLHIAMLERRFDSDMRMIEILLQAGANPNMIDAYGFTPLHIAVLQGRLDIVKALLVAKALPNTSSSDGFTPLQSAVLCKNGEMVALLLEWRADPNTLHTGQGTSALHLAAELGLSDIVKALIAAGCPVDIKSTGGLTPLRSAISAEKTEVVALLLQSGAQHPSPPNPTLSSLALAQQTTQHKKRKMAPSSTSILCKTTMQIAQTSPKDAFKKVKDYPLLLAELGCQDHTKINPQFIQLLQSLRNKRMDDALHYQSQLDEEYAQSQNPTYLSSHFASILRAVQTESAWTTPCQWEELPQNTQQLMSVIRHSPGFFIEFKKYMDLQSKNDPQQKRLKEKIGYIKALQTMLPLVPQLPNDPQEQRGEAYKILGEYLGILRKQKEPGKQGRPKKQKTE